MRLIDADVLTKAITEQIRDFVAEEDKECFRFAWSMVEGIPTAKAIPIDWMRKEMVEMLYDGERVTDKDRYILNKLIERWEKENG